MTPEQATEILLQAVKLAQSKGAFSLEDAELVSLAVKALTPKQVEDVKEEITE